MNAGRVQPETGPPSNLRDMCRKYGIRFKKGLGQNLLLDDNINRIMTDAADLSRADDVGEVGAGLGALTRRLAACAGRVLAVEIDASFMPSLEDQFGGSPHIKLFRGDILNHEIPRLLDEFLPGGSQYKMVSNLPYYITTPILFQFLESPVPFSRIVVMIQEEVGQRMVAPVNTPEYGVLGIAARLHAEIDIVHRVPASCFVPRPKVDSCIVRLRRRASVWDLGVESAFLIKVVRAAFQQRRKTLRNSLAGSAGFGVPKTAVLAAFEAAGIDPGRRPQTLDIPEFAALAREIHKRL